MVQVSVKDFLGSDQLDQETAVDSPTAGSSGTARSLTSVRLTDRCDLEGVHSDFGVVDLHLGVTCVNNV